MSKSSPYRVLGVKINDSQEVIDKAYRAIAGKNHPDRNNGVVSPIFREAVEAYEIIGDPDKRKEYDRLAFSELSALAPSFYKENPTTLERLLKKLKKGDCIKSCRLYSKNKSGVDSQLLGCTLEITLQNQEDLPKGGVQNVVNSFSALSGTECYVSEDRTKITLPLSENTRSELIIAMDTLFADKFNYEATGLRALEWTEFKSEKNRKSELTGVDWDLAHNKHLRENAETGIVYAYKMDKFPLANHCLALGITSPLHTKKPDYINFNPFSSVTSPFFWNHPQGSLDFQSYIAQKLKQYIKAVKIGTKKKADIVLPGFEPGDFPLPDGFTQMPEKMRRDYYSNAISYVCNLSYNDPQLKRINPKTGQTSEADSGSYIIPNEKTYGRLKAVEAISEEVVCEIAYGEKSKEAGERKPPQKGRGR